MLNRRHFLQTSLGLAAMSALPVGAVTAAPISRVRPGMLGWPSDTEWAALYQATNGRLARVTPPALTDTKQLLANPFYIGDQPALTQSSGWLDAWRSSPSAYVVTAESAADVAAAVRLRAPIICAWSSKAAATATSAPPTRRTPAHLDPENDAVTVHDRFTPAGSSRAPVPAVSLGSGCKWLHAYQAVTGGAGRYVQGGGCTTVGVTGLVLGGGFGSFSKAYGTAADSLLEAEIVTADGATRIVNEAREPDLLWALKGGGGGTFGVVTRLTLATHQLPDKSER